MAVSPLVFLIATVIVLFGFGLFILIASTKRRGSHRIFNFFVAGQTLPTDLAGEVYWGNSLALGNGIAFFATLTLFWGPAALWVQVPWVIGMFFLGRVAPLIGQATQRHTLHGFLGKQLGFGARSVTSLVTTFGFVLNMGFEVMIGALLIGYLLGSTEIVWPAIIITALFFAAYCNIGGYRANAVTDKIQNRLGVLVVTALVLYYWVGPSMGIGSDQISQGRAEFVTSIFDFSSVPIWTFGGMCLYAFFVQFVDMSNWQNISATRLSGANWEVNLRRDFKWAAVKSLIIPGILCVALAAPLAGQNLSDEVVVGELLKGALPTDGIIAGILWGLAMVALLGAMQSTADSFLMASTQTLSWDIFDRKRVEAVLDVYDDSEIQSGSSDQTLPIWDNKTESAENELEKTEYSITRFSRLALFPIALVGSLGLYGIKEFLTDNIIQLMFLIFGSQLALLPATATALWSLRKKRALKSVAKILLVFSIVAGFITSVSTIAFNPSIPGIVDYAPYFALGVSGAIWLFGFVLSGGSLFAKEQP